MTKPTDASGQPAQGRLQGALRSRFDFLFGAGPLLPRGGGGVLKVDRHKAAHDPADLVGATGQAARNFFQGEGRTHLSGDFFGAAADEPHLVDLPFDRHFVDVLTRSLALISPLRVPRVRDLPRAHTRSGAPAM